MGTCWRARRQGDARAPPSLQKTRPRSRTAEDDGEKAKQFAVIPSELASRFYLSRGLWIYWSLD